MAVSTLKSYGAAMLLLPEDELADLVIYYQVLPKHLTEAKDSEKCNISLLNKWITLCSTKGETAFNFYLQRKLEQAQITLLKF